MKRFLFLSLFLAIPLIVPAPADARGGPRNRNAPAPEINPPPAGSPTSPPPDQIMTVSCNGGETYVGEGTVVSLRACETIKDTHTGCKYTLRGFYKVEGGSPTRACFDVTMPQVGAPLALCLGPQDQNVSFCPCQTTVEVLKDSYEGRHALVTLPLRPGGPTLPTSCSGNGNGTIGETGGSGTESSGPEPNTNTP